MFVTLESLAADLLPVLISPDSPIWPKKIGALVLSVISVSPYVIFALFAIALVLLCSPFPNHYTIAMRIRTGFAAVLGCIARFCAWVGPALILVTCFDVLTRYFGLPKPFGLNSTMIQDSEWWMHALLFATLIGYGYLHGAHVRIDIFARLTSVQTRLFVEIAGCLVFMLPYFAFAFNPTFEYAKRAFLIGEASKSAVGLGEIWLVKMLLPLMFVLLALAALTRILDVIAALQGRISDDKQLNKLIS